MECNCKKKVNGKYVSSDGEGENINIIDRIIHFFAQLFFGIICGIVIIIVIVPILLYIIICIMFGKHIRFNLGKVINKFIHSQMNGNE